MLDEGVYQELAGPEDFLAVQKAIEDGGAEVDDDRLAKLTTLSVVEGSELTPQGRALYDDMQRQREGILERLRAGRVLSAADLRGEAPGGVPLVHFEDSIEDEDIFVRAVVDWMCLCGELRYEHQPNRFVPHE